MIAFSIRRAVPDDLDVLLALCMALQDHLEKCNPSVWHTSSQGQVERRRDLALAIKSDDDLVLVACDPAGSAIGMAIGHIQRQDRYEPSLAGLIGRVFVQEAWRCCGVGRALVGDLVVFFQRRQVDEIAVQYVVGNREAERFWTRLGFEPRIIRAGASLAQLRAHLSSSERLDSQSNSL